MILRLPSVLAPLLGAAFLCSAQTAPSAVGSPKGAPEAKAPAKPDPTKKQAPPPSPAASLKQEANDAEEDIRLQGEFSGKMREADFAMQVISLGKGQFDAVLSPGGLPGAGWTKQPPTRQRVSGKRDGTGNNASVRFSGNGWTANLTSESIELLDIKGTGIGSLKRIERKSPTLGLSPPPGAVVLFDGKNTDSFMKGARMTSDGLLMEGCTSLQQFGDCTLHLEFQLSYMPEKRGQERSNSGVYLQGRYEVQVLDSFGLNGENNECGGLYTIAKPQVNMCLPPLVWQTYDIEFQAPDFDATGKKTEDAHFTVKHNGVLIHDGVTVTHPTPAAPFTNEAPKGPLYLQNHNNPVRFRNIWILPK